jgi:hypothetical protein
MISLYPSFWECPAPKHHDFSVFQRIEPNPAASAEVALICVNCGERQNGLSDYQLSANRAHSFHSPVGRYEPTIFIQELWSPMMIFGARIQRAVSPSKPLRYCGLVVGLLARRVGDSVSLPIWLPPKTNHRAILTNAVIGKQLVHDVSIQRRVRRQADDSHPYFSSPCRSSIDRYVLATSWTQNEPPMGGTQRSCHRLPTKVRL